MSNKVYDILKYVAQIVLPSLATLYIALASLWDWGYIEQVTGTITAVDTFLGALLRLTKSKYDKEDKTNE